MNLSAWSISRMTNSQWNSLIGVLKGDVKQPLPAGFVIDSPWLPNWYGVEIAEYFWNQEIWFAANRTAVQAFPECLFFPGFWVEFGMCTEPSAFDAKCLFPANEFPHAEKIITDVSQINGIKEPNPATDGLLPLTLNRMKWARPRMEEMGHKVMFSVSRGPLNIASFLMGTTEFLMAMKTDPGAIHDLLAKITSFLRKWHDLQRQSCDSIDGIFVLDDIVGFIGEDDFKEFAMPYLGEIFSADAKVKFFHNDAPCEKSIGYYPEMGINLYNPGIQCSVTRLKKLSSGRITILGNIPPRDVLANGTPDEVGRAVRLLVYETNDKSRWIPSCGGGVPPGVTTENLKAFLDAVRGVSGC